MPVQQLSSPSCCSVLEQHLIQSCPAGCSLSWSTIQTAVLLRPCFSPARRAPPPALTGGSRASPSSRAPLRGSGFLRASGRRLPSALSQPGRDSAVVRCVLPSCSSPGSRAGSPSTCSWSRTSSVGPVRVFRAPHPVRVRGTLTSSPSSVSRRPAAPHVCLVVHSDLLTPRSTLDRAHSSPFHFV